MAALGFRPPPVFMGCWTERKNTGVRAAITSSNRQRGNSAEGEKRHICLTSNSLKQTQAAASGSKKIKF